MAPRSLQHQASLARLRDELIYTEARLSADAQASEHTPVFSVLLTREEEAAAAQRAQAREEVIAQAHVDAADDALDGLTDAFEVELRMVSGQDRSAPLYKRFFKVPRHKVVRLGLESQLEVARDWPAAIEAVGEARLTPFAERLRAVIAQGEQALARRRRAQQASADHRLMVLVPLVDDANKARQSVHGALQQTAAERSLGKHWSRGFFKR